MVYGGSDVNFFNSEIILKTKKDKYMGILVSCLIRRHIQMVTSSGIVNACFGNHSG